VLGIDDVRGDRGEARVEAAVAWRVEKKAAGEYYSGGRPESGTWDLQAAGGGADRVTATASGGEARLGQMTRATWRGQGRPARGRGTRRQGREGHVARCRMALRWRGWRTWLARAAAARGRETEEREREVDEGGPSCKLQKVQGPYCNAQITFKPELK
jgi:hypothetical protein